LCKNSHEFKEVLLKGVFLNHHDSTEFASEIKLAAIVGDFEVSLEKIPQLLGIIKVYKFSKKS
jgi:hypothetical protein